MNSFWNEIQHAQEPTSLGHRSRYKLTCCQKIQDSTLSVLGEYKKIKDIVKKMTKIYIYIYRKHSRAMHNDEYSNLLFLNK